MLATLWPSRSRRKPVFQQAGKLSVASRERQLYRCNAALKVGSTGSGELIGAFR